MTKVAIIGNAGGGKSTIARTLRDLLKLPLYQVDQLQWRPGWRQVPEEEFTVAHNDLLNKPRWIIDGWGDFDAIQKRFIHADTIILVDYPLWHHYWWALKRQFMCLFQPRIDGPPGCPMLPVTWRLLKMIWWIHKQATPRLRDLVETQRSTKKVFCIRSNSDLWKFYSEVSAFAQKT